jgi:uncharacterized protein YecT (DUF1311 family)
MAAGILSAGTWQVSTVARAAAVDVVRSPNPSGPEMIIMLRVALILLAIVTSASAQELNPNGLTEREYQECGERWGAPGAIAECLRQRDKAYGVQLEETYKRALDVTPDKTLVRSAQRSWLNYQETTCHFHEVYFQSEGIGIAQALAARCLLLTTLQRLRELYPVLKCTWDDERNRVKC